MSQASSYFIHGKRWAKDEKYLTLFVHLINLILLIGA